MAPKSGRGSRSGEGAPDFRALFEAAPGNLLALAADAPVFTIVAASHEYFAATHTTRAAVIGRALFDALPPDNPGDSQRTSVESLRASLCRVLETKAPDVMPIRRYDVRLPDGSWEERHWAARNAPVLDASGDVRYVLHQVEDVTETMLERIASADTARREAELHAVLQSMSDAVYIGTSEGVTIANQAALEQLGFDSRVELMRPVNVLAREVVARDAATGQPLPPERRPFARALAGERVVTDVVVQHRLTGEERVVRAAAAPVMVDGRVVAAVSVNTDVTATRHAAAETQRLIGQLRIERERLRNLIQMMPAPVALHIGPEHRIEIMSEAFREISRGRDLTGMTPQEAYPEVVGQGILERFDEVRETGIAWISRETYARFDRRGLGIEDTWFDIRYEPVRDPAGEVIGVLNFSFDVTDQVRARHDVERLLAESERARADADAARNRSEAVLGSIADAFYLLDREWRFIYVNDAAEPLLQTTRGKLLGRTLWDAFPGVRGSEFEGPYLEAMSTGRPTSVEAYFEPLTTWFDVRSYPWKDGLMVHFRDISARVASEVEREKLLHALDVERSRLSDVFRRAPSFIVVFRGPDHTYEFVNEAYYQLVGHRSIIGKPLLEAIPEIRGQGFDGILTNVLETGEPWVGREAPVQLQRTPGAELETRYLDMVFQALTEADGTRSGVVVHGSDITAQVLARREVERLLGESERARAEAEAARQEAELANRGKSEFLAVMSHELRTPLNAIGGYAELMELGIRGPITAEQRADLARIQQSQRHLLGLINGVLNYARVEAGAVHYALEEVALEEVCAACEALIAPQVRARGIAFERDCTLSDLRVRADREKLQQVVLNLLSNAVKFTDAGGRIALQCHENDGVPATASVEVSDSGIGISADQLSRVFEPFVQVDAKLTRTREGTGLGLAISRDLARGMGGELTAESVPGRGSRFTLTLPRIA